MQFSIKESTCKMKGLTLFYAGVMLLGVFISAVSQVILKKEAMKPHISRFHEYLNTNVITAYTIFFVSTMMTIIAYREIPLSLGPVLEATSYIYVTVFGIVIFKEKFSLTKFCALALILAGILIYAFME